MWVFVGAISGFLIAAMPVFGLWERLKYGEGIPRYLRGMPLVLLTSALAALAFMGLGGVIR